ncbi:AraC family transcriptional regulator [Terriglobus albidus]|uniref:AraC family transcriptional regulator n=1 Tax=Terriglobus albidus TaxID=1592106 RepID=A0A5B9E4P6_9BACT|nr:helix-turn-helix domain-containing protein [Terriglobus albidus]QEE26544.1 AraC family transcriptional regulator [Terriglobus albidus]
MIYLEYKPKAPLAGWVKALWYVRTPGIVSTLQRVLPNGDTQIVINLAHAHCHGVLRSGERFLQAPSLLVGLQHGYQTIDLADTEEMVGVVFAPGGQRRFFAEPATELCGEETDLESLLGKDAATLRERLMDVSDPELKFAVLESFLCGRLGAAPLHPAVRSMLLEIRRHATACSLADASKATGLTDRRVRDLFREEIGVSPKSFLRILRFQRAVQQLHQGTELPWAELALECGYYDQSHFANEFYEFSGISPTAYSRVERPWANHLVL